VNVSKHETIKKPAMLCHSDGAKALSEQLNIGTKEVWARLVRSQLPRGAASESSFASPQKPPFHKGRSDAKG
jgi:hypothetical protein